MKIDSEKINDMVESLKFIADDSKEVKENIEIQEADGCEGCAFMSVEECGKCLVVSVKEVVRTIEEEVKRMKIKLLALMLGIMLLVPLCACDNTNECIEIQSKSSYVLDDININLDDGYWVKDYSIDYDNMQVVLNLKKDDSNE